MPDYEYADAMSIGGGAGVYTLPSPWNGPCEYCIRVVSASGAGGLCVSYDTAAGIAVSDTTVTNTTSAYNGELINFHAANTITPAALFARCPTGTLKFTVTGSSNILATVHFRRRLGFAFDPEVLLPGYEMTEEEYQAARAQYLEAQARRLSDAAQTGGR